MITENKQLLMAYSKAISASKHNILNGAIDFDLRDSFHRAIGESIGYAKVLKLDPEIVKKCFCDSVDEFNYLHEELKR